MQLCCRIYAIVTMVTGIQHHFIVRNSNWSILYICAKYEINPLKTYRVIFISKIWSKTHKISTISMISSVCWLGGGGGMASGEKVNLGRVFVLLYI